MCISAFYFWPLKWLIFENMPVKQTKEVCGNECKNLLYIEKILKDKNERKTGDAMEKTLPFKIIYLFFISTFPYFTFGDFPEGLMSPGSS